MSTQPNYSNFAKTPWKVTNEFRRYMGLPIVRLYFIWHGVSWGKRWRIFGRPLIQKHGGSEINIGSDFEMRNWFNSTPLGINHRCVLATWSENAIIRIGDSVGLTGTTICSQSSITIGNRVLIGANSTIVDTDFHPLDVSARRENSRAGRTAPVIIEDDVFIGMQVLILKGSHIGRGSVVGAGSVVSGTVPPGAIVAGNPFQVIKH